MTRSSADSSPLIVLADDDVHFLRLMEHHLLSWGFRVVPALDKLELHKILSRSQPSALLLDVRLGQDDGVELLKPLLDRDPGLNVIMMTAHGSIDGAVAAIRLGAHDYITKPVDLDRLRATINHVIDDARCRKSSKRREAGAAPEPLKGVSRPILGVSHVTRGLIEQIANVAATEATVMVLGESGTGKELVARAIHEMSTRNQGPFVAINVAALPRELVESTLFGHEKGAFTGADRTQIGCCQAADRGTLFLDEIGEMELGLQAKLLRFLQERAVHPVGRSGSISVDVRIVTATHREPLEQVRLGRLREDLYYRLNVVPIRVPPLRSRREDIPVLAVHFLQTALARHRRPEKTFSADALEALKDHSWPGNVRELENAVERLAILVSDSTIQREHLRAHLEGFSDGFDKVPSLAQAPISSAIFEKSEPMSEFERIERQAIIESLSQTSGSVREAAKRLGIGQATIYRKIKKYQISN